MAVRPAEQAAAQLRATAMRLTVRRLMVVAAFTGIFALATKVSFDPDTWWHLRAGQWMLQHHQILLFDAFSRSRSGQPWINHSWLSQVLMFLVWKAFGMGGLNVLTAGFVTLAFCFVYLQTEGSIYLRTFALLLAALSSAVYWWARPEIVSFALAAVFAYVIALFRWQSTDRLWILPPLMALWANLHGGFVIGLLLLIMTLAGQVGSRIFGQRGAGVVEKSDISRFAIVVLACAAATAANPHGPGILLSPLQTVSIGALREYVHEWMSPDFHSPEAQSFVWLLLATFASVALSRKRIDLTDLLLFSGFVYLALMARRNIALFALVAPPILTRHAAAGLDALGARYRGLKPITDRSGAASPHGALNWVLLAGIVGIGVARVSIPLHASVNAAAMGQVMPVGAVDYIWRARPAGPMFNSYNWGGYLAWALPRDYPVYIDGRTDLYGDKFLREYVRVVSGDDEWRAAFARGGIRLVVLESGAPLAQILAHEPGWRRVYTDTLASVFQHE